MEPIGDAGVLWDRLLREKTVLPDKSYDADLETELRLLLGISSTEDFVQALSNIRADVFVCTLFGVAAPFAEMSSAMLSLCERIDAKRGDEPNLEIRFDLDASLPPLDLNLNAFRQTTSNLRRITRSRSTRHWNSDALGAIMGATTRLLEQLGISDRFGSLISDDRGWSRLTEPAPMSGMTEIDEIVDELWGIRQAFIAELAPLWPGRGEDALPMLHELEANSDLIGFASNNWERIVGDSLASLCRFLETSDRARRAEVVDELNEFVRRIRELLRLLPVVERSVEEDIEELIELLSLPMWGRRHELYSAWVFTRIVEAIGFERLQFNLTNNRLSFAFAGVHLATFDTIDGSAEVWAERRIPYDGSRGTPLLGKGRTGGVQPDYCLLIRGRRRDPVFAAVECKQYKRASSEHAKVLHDYTVALPAAVVVLACYGPVRRTVKKKLPLGAEQRTHAVAKLRPGLHEALTDFSAALQAAIPAPPPSIPRPGILNTATTSLDRVGDLRVELSWCVAKVDLDLYAIIENRHLVSYRNLRGRVSGTEVILEGDVTTPPGPEVMRISGERRVDVLVHVFTSTPEALAGASVRIVSSDGTATVVDIGSHGAAVRWIHICTIFPDRIEIVNREIDDSPAFPRS